MDNIVRIKKNGKVIAEISMGDFPLDVSGMFINGRGEWVERSFKWVLSYHRDAETWQKLLSKPRGTQLQ